MRRLLICNAVVLFASFCICAAGNVLHAEDNAEPLGSVVFRLMTPSGGGGHLSVDLTNADVVLSGTSYERSLFVCIGRLWLYGDGGGLQSTPDGCGKFRKGTRVLVNKETKCGFAIGEDGEPSAFLIDDKAVDRLIGAGRYQYIGTGTGKLWFDVFSGLVVDPNSGDLEKIVLVEKSRLKRLVTLSEFINCYQKALDELYLTDDVYRRQLPKSKDPSEKLAAAISYHKSKAAK